MVSVHSPAVLDRVVPAVAFRGRTAICTLVGPLSISRDAGTAAVYLSTLA